MCPLLSISASIYQKPSEKTYWSENSVPSWPNLKRVQLSVYILWAFMSKQINLFLFVLLYMKVQITFPLQTLFFRMWGRRRIEQRLYVWDQMPLMWKSGAEYLKRCPVSTKHLPIFWAIQEMLDFYKFPKRDIRLRHLSFKGLLINKIPIVEKLVSPRRSMWLIHQKGPAHAWNKVQ